MKPWETVLGSRLYAENQNDPRIMTMLDEATVNRLPEILASQCGDIVNLIKLAKLAEDYLVAWKATGISPDNIVSELIDDLIDSMKMGQDPDLIETLAAMGITEEHVLTKAGMNPQNLQQVVDGTLTVQQLVKTQPELIPIGVSVATKILQQG
jgi:hypothetical protein